MRIVPVIDLRAGVVVRGVGGRRHEYRPVVSRLTPSSRPADVACAFRDHFGLTELYLADLDAIAGAPPALATYEALLGLGFRLWVDAGLRGPETAGPLAAAGVQGLVAGLETLAGPEALAALCRAFGDRVVFSLDLKGGRPLGDLSVWTGAEPFALAAEAVGLGARRLLVLDLARVGEGGGTGTEDLCRRLSRAYPAVELAAGGGVRGVTDLRRLRDCGVAAALLASALHDGTLGPGDWAG
jgi:phosphoribosylformimino-5-aminoimidazole carboxamide ribotide isomerase